MSKRSELGAMLGALACCLAVGLWAPGLARAHPGLDRAERELEEAQFEQAATTLAELAGARADLSRSDVARLLRLRAVVDLALGRDADVERDLVALASVLDGREPGPMPPQLERRYHRARAEVHGPPVVRLRIDGGPDGHRVALEVERDPGELTRETEVVCEAGGVEVARASARLVEVATTDTLSCRGSAIGPGGWIVDTAEARHMGAAGEGTDDELPWPWILGGAGAAIVLAIAIGVGVAVGSQRGVGGPTWVMP